MCGRQVSTTRFQDFYDLDAFLPGEIQTELHFAGKVYQARAIVSAARDGKNNAQMVLVFSHEGKDYMLDIFRKPTEGSPPDPRSLPGDKDIRRMLDAYFYFDG